MVNGQGCLILVSVNKKSLKIVCVSAALALGACDMPSPDSPPTSEQTTPQAATAMSFYDFQVNAIDGSPFDLSSLKGKKILVVNTASECGLTPQYSQLQELHETFAGEAFVILGFPANNFGAQEPGSNQEIAGFCQANYGVSFQMMEKISVIGQDVHPLYKWLATEASTEVAWNFHKFLIDAEGQVVRDVAPNVEPASEEITTWIQS